jgi:hypothetical protein
MDHVGYHDAFMKAELIVQREHYALARSGHPRFAAARAHWDHPALRYRMIDGDTELLPGLTLLVILLIILLIRSISLAVFLPNRYTKANRTLLGKNLLGAHAMAHLTRGADAESPHLYTGLVAHDPDLRTLRKP